MIRRVRQLYHNDGVVRVLWGVNDYIQNHLFTSLSGFLSGDLIWEKDWDVLCILDGCRVDTFRNVYDRNCESLTSVGSTSSEWIQSTFVNQQYQDLSEVGYISANPHASNLDPDQFGELCLVGVQETDYGVETVPPDVLTDLAINCWHNRDDISRLVVHYMQPHVPFRSRPEWFTSNVGEDSWGADIWKQIRYDLDREALFEAYRDNLDWVLGEDGITTLINSIDAKVALTADHGNAAGEWNVYGHPFGAPTKEVRHVPWAEISANKSSGYSTSEVDVKDFDAEEQLDALGYK
ncbi:hypothetical protein [Haloarchaeobius amylolyticus]|uniref:hypothetical protein n=1 Tax=Haloarchaeobius amylolyticus TaxID=1198296 RepID=UPI00226F0C17|nr:hypothetical protein [Haloarchaeobius amylolyticus]